MYGIYLDSKNKLESVAPGENVCSALRFRLCRCDGPIGIGNANEDESDDIRGSSLSSAQQNGVV